MRFCLQCIAGTSSQNSLPRTINSNTPALSPNSGNYAGNQLNFTDGNSYGSMDTRKRRGKFIKRSRNKLRQFTSRERHASADASVENVNSNSLQHSGLFHTVQILGDGTLHLQKGQNSFVSGISKGKKINGSKHLLSGSSLDSKGFFSNLRKDPNISLSKIWEERSNFSRRFSSGTSLNRKSYSNLYHGSNLALSKISSSKKNPQTTRYGFLSSETKNNASVRIKALENSSLKGNASNLTDSERNWHPSTFKQSKESGNKVKDDYTRLLKSIVRGVESKTNFESSKVSHNVSNVPTSVSYTIRGVDSSGASEIQRAAVNTTRGSKSAISSNNTSVGRNDTLTKFDVSKEKSKIIDVMDKKLDALVNEMATLGRNSGKSNFVFNFVRLLDLVLLRRESGQPS